MLELLNAIDAQSLCDAACGIALIVVTVFVLACMAAVATGGGRKG